MLSGPAFRSAMVVLFFAVDVLASYFFIYSYVNNQLDVCSLLLLYFLVKDANNFC
jgi:hypothetical protein